MKKPVRTLGAAVAALAAPALLALPATAGTRGAIASLETRLGHDTTLTLSVGTSGYDPRYGPYDRYGLNPWGQSDREVRALRRDAEAACRQAIRYEARQAGFRDVDIDDDIRFRQTGPYGFLLNFREVEFESRHRDIETRVTCETRGGYVVSLSGLPARPHPGKGHGRRW
ncbi:MAG: hypothetical protein ACK4HR_08260 [Hyphomonas sp.]|jgi:hypothetical protein